MRVNPILKKDVKVASRSMKLSLEILAFEAILLIIFLFSIKYVFDYGAFYYYGSVGDRLRELVSLFPILSATEVVMVGLVLPIMTASSITGEKERQTFDIMLTTSMSPIAIVIGKVQTAITKMMLFIVASIPIMAISFVMGGLSWGYLFAFLVLIFIYSIFCASLGIFCSSICAKSISSIILSYVFYGVFYGATFIPMLISVLNGGEGRLVVNFLLINPVMLFEEFYLHMMEGSSAINELNYYSSSWLYDGKHWMYLCAIAILLVSIGLMLLTAKKIDPMKNKKIKQPKKKAE